MCIIYMCIYTLNLVDHQSFLGLFLLVVLSALSSSIVEQ